MFHNMNAKSFCKKFAKNEIILIGNDIGPLRCFESIGSDFLQQKFSIYIQSGELKSYVKKTEMGFSFVNISIFQLLFKLMFKPSCAVIILQSSYVSFLESLVLKIHNNIYVLQDFKNDYKFGLAVKYVTAFESIPNINFKDVSVYVLDSLRPKISTHVSNIMGNDLLLIIGAKKLLLFDGCMDFFETILKFSKVSHLKVYYKPHPGEDITEYGEDFFPSRGVALISELPIEKSWPKLIVSPHSSLGYDIPERISIIANQKFRVLHSFGIPYDKQMLLYPGFEEMTSTKALNFNLNQLQEFFNE